MALDDTDREGYGSARRVECEVCRTPTVALARRDVPGVEVWRCTSCGEVKQWCPRRAQGWVRRRRLGALGPELYVCDECGATWVAAAEMTPPGTDLEGYLRARGVEYGDADLLLVREIEPGAPVV